MKTIDKVEVIIKSQKKVVFLKGNPGVGKSAMFSNIAKKHDWNFYDIRLSMSDSSDFLIPRFKKMEDGTEVTTFSIPQWAYESNQRPTLVFFDELNRAKLDVRNACLQMLLDRKLGQYKFNNNVYFASAGNLGEEDGCEVEDFDLALKDRLATIKYDPSVKEWVEEFAKDNVNSYVVNFLEKKPEYRFKYSENDDNICTFRSLTFLSDLIGKSNKNIESIIDIVVNFGETYIGSSAKILINYLVDMKAITAEDILKRFPEIKDRIKDYDRSRLCELITEMTEKKISKMKVKEFDNLISFLKIVNAEERVTFITKSLLESDDLIEDSNASDEESPLTIKSVYAERIKTEFYDDIVNIINASDSIKIEEVK